MYSSFQNICGHLIDINFCALRVPIQEFTQFQLLCQMHRRVAPVEVDPVVSIEINLHHDVLMLPCQSTSY